MKCRQYGVFVENINKKTKESELMVLVFYERGHALEIEKEYRNLDSIPRFDMYIQKLQQLKPRSKIRISDIDTSKITQSHDKVYYTNDFFGCVMLLSSTPIKIEGWELTD